MRTPRTASRFPCRNQLLAGLPPADLEQLLPDLEPIAVPVRHVLLQPGEALREVYFPGAGVYSLTRQLDGAGLVEVVAAGNEGFIGIEALFDGSRASTGALATVADPSAVAMSLAAFRRHLIRGGAFRQALNAYAQAFTGLLMAVAACHARHSVEQRCAGWLLTARECVGFDAFPITQELVAGALGVRRATITVLMMTFERNRLIYYQRNALMILDREGLEAVACGCYRLARRTIVRPQGIRRR